LDNIDINTLKEYFKPTTPTNTVNSNYSAGGRSVVKRYLNKLYKCPDGRLRKAFRIQGKGNTIFVTCKKNIVKAKSIPKSKKSLS